MHLTVLEWRRRRKKKKKENDNSDDFRFFKIRFLGFYKAELESKDTFVLRRVRAFHFVDLEVSYDVLSPLPILLSKHFNNPHPYIEIATVISDTIAVHIIYRVCLRNAVIQAVFVTSQ